MEGPLVSIVTPAYNQADYVRQTIESVVTQDYRPIEYLVIDDGSTDGTRSILEGYGGGLRWLSQPNQGQTATINRGWALMHGDILGWLNSDDTLLPSAVRKVVGYLQDHPEIDIVFGDTLFTDAEGRPLRRSAPRPAFDYVGFVLSCQNPIPQPSAFVRSAVVQAEGLLDTTFRYFMDWDYWMRAGLHHRIAYTPELISTYRLHPASNTVTKNATFAPELEYMYRKYFARHDIPPAIRGREARAMAAMYLTSGGYFAAGGDPVAAARSGLRAFKARPVSFLLWRFLRQLLFCLLSSSWPYRTARRLRRHYADGASA